MVANKALINGSSGHQVKMIIGGIVTLGLALGLWFTHMPGVNTNQQHFLALLAMVISLWGFEIIPVGIGALFFLALVVMFKITSPLVAFSGFSVPTVWLVFSALIIGIAAENTGLGKRMAFWMITKAKADSPGKIMLAFYAVGAILTPLIPTVFGRLAILIPIALGLIAALKLAQGDRMAKFILFSMYIGAQGIMLMFLTGTSQALIATGLLAHFGVRIYWDTYFVMWVVPSLVVNGGIWAIATYILFKPGKQHWGGNILQVTGDERDKMGSMTVREKKLAIILLVIFFFWVTGSVTHLNPSWVGVIGTVCLFLPFVGVLELKDIVGKLNFPVLLFFGSALSIGEIMSKIGLDKWFSKLIADNFHIANSGFMSTLTLGALIQALHIPLTAVNSSTAILVPILGTYSVNHGISPVWAAWVALASLSGILIFPYQDGPLLAVYGAGGGHIKMADMIKVGIIVSVLALIAVPLLSVVWWSWTIPMMTGH